MRALRGSDGEKAHGLLRGRAYRYAFATLLCAVALVPPAAAAARDLVVYGEPTLQAALKSIGFLWQAAPARASTFSSRRRTSRTPRSIAARAVT